MNNIFEVEKRESATSFEKNINEIKDNHLKIISCAAMNLSAITYFYENFDPISMDKSFEAVKL